MFQDFDNDWIDDRTYNALITTFDNVFQNIQDVFPNISVTIWTICSITDKKSYIPTIFQSMVRSNIIFREKLKYLVENNSHVSAAIISASTVATDTEKEFRKFSTEQAFRVSWKTVACELINLMSDSQNSYIDQDLFTFNPRYESYYKNETDEMMMTRIRWEIFWLYK